MPTSRPAPTSDKLSEILDYYSDVEELKDEMETWLDSIPDSLQSSDKYSQIDDAVNTLESGYSGLEDACGGIKEILEKFPSILDADVHYIEHKMYKGYQMPRWVRLANPVGAIEAMASHIEKLMPIEGMSEYDAEELKQHLSGIDDAVSGLNGVEFPSMYG